MLLPTLITSRLAEARLQACTAARRVFHRLSLLLPAGGAAVHIVLWLLVVAQAPLVVSLHLGAHLHMAVVARRRLGQERTMPRPNLTRASLEAPAGQATTVVMDVANQRLPVSFPGAQHLVSGQVAVGIRMLLVSLTEGEVALATTAVGAVRVEILLINLVAGAARLT